MNLPAGVKRLSVFVCLCVCAPLYSLDADAIIGLWYGPPDSNGRSVVLQFFADGDVYNAVPVGYWGMGQGRGDSPATRHARVVMLSEITHIYGLTFSGGMWKDGSVHNPVGASDFTLRVKIDNDRQRAVLRVSADRYGILGMSQDWRPVPLEDYSNYGSLSPDERDALFGNK